MTLTSLPRTALDIDEKTYNVCSVTCHHGISLHYGHYNTMIKKKNRICRLDVIMTLFLVDKDFFRNGKDDYI